LVVFGLTPLQWAGFLSTESKTTTTTAASQVSFRFSHSNIMARIVWNQYTLGEGWNHEEGQNVVDAGHN